MTASIQFRFAGSEAAARPSRATKQGHSIGVPLAGGLAGPRQLTLPGVVMPLLKRGPWSPEEIAHLRLLWDDHKLSLRACAAILNRSPNAVTGKVAREKMESRGSPIIWRNMPSERALKRRMKRAEIPPRKTLGWDFPAPDRCVWPTTARSPWQFCCEPIEPGRPYCAAHVKRAYLPPSPRSERAFVILPAMRAA